VEFLSSEKLKKKKESTIDLTQQLSRDFSSCGFFILPNCFFFIFYLYINTTTNKMFKRIIDSFLNWLRSLFWKQEMELTLVGLQASGKTTLVNVIAVRNLIIIFKL